MNGIINILSYLQSFFRNYNNFNILQRFVTSRYSGATGIQNYIYLNNLYYLLFIINFMCIKSSTRKNV